MKKRSIAKRVIEVVLKGLAFVFIPYFIGLSVNNYTDNVIYEAQGNLLIWVFGVLVISVCTGLCMLIKELYEYITLGYITE